MFTLAISCLTTSNLPWFMDLTFQVPMKYCSLQHQDFTFTTRHIHNWSSFLLWPNHFILTGVVSKCPLLFPGSILHTFQPGGRIIQPKRSVMQKLRNSSIKRQQRCRKCCNIHFARKIWKTSWHSHTWQTLSLFRNQLTFTFSGNHALHLSPPGWISYSFMQLFHCYFR